MKLTQLDEVESFKQKTRITKIERRQASKENLLRSASIHVFYFVYRCPVLLVTGEKSVFNTTTRNLHKAIVKVCQNKSHVEFLEIPRVANVFEENPADVRDFKKPSNNGAFTLAVTQTETDYKYTELYRNLCCYLSLCSMNTSIQFRRTQCHRSRSL